MHSLKYPKFMLCAAVAAMLCLTTDAAGAGSLDRVLERLDKLETENHQLRMEIDALKAERDAVTPGAGLPRYS